jgi:RNA polymerase sigma-70 factor (ECF subfamily)
LHFYEKTMNTTAELVRPKPLSLQDQVAAAYEEFRDDLYRYLLLLGLSPAQAQETAQDTFLRMYLALRGGTQQNPTKIRHTRAWIFTVAHNLALNLRQSEQGIHLFDPTADLEFASSDPDPEHRAMENQRNSRLHDALASLSDQQRHCLLLRAEGFRYREIADIIGVGTSTVGEFLRRAISRLRKTVYEQ